MLRSSARTRTLAAGVAVFATTTILSACDKPLPSVSVFTGSTTKKVDAQPTCVLTGCSIDKGKITTLNAKAGSQILVDVPRKLANQGWIVAAFSTDSSGNNTPIEGAGSSPIKGEHSVRLNVPVSTGGYFLRIAQTPVAHPDKTLTTWLVAVTLSQ